MEIKFPIDITSYNFKIKVDIQKRFSDLDAYFHVNNCTQQTYFDIGRERYLQKIYGNDVHVSENNQTLFIVSYKTDFLNQITYKADIEVCTAIYHVGNKSIKMMQILRDKQTSTIYTVSDSTMAAVDLQTRESITIPDIWKQRIIDLEK